MHLEGVHPDPPHPSPPSPPPHPPRSFPPFQPGELCQRFFDFDSRGEARVYFTKSTRDVRYNRKPEFIPAVRRLDATRSISAIVKHRRSDSSSQNSAFITRRYSRSLTSILAPEFHFLKLRVVKSRRIVFKISTSLEVSRFFHKII